MSTVVEKTDFSPRIQTSSSRIQTSSVATTKGWHASLELRCFSTGKETVVSKKKHVGPLRVQRAFYPEADGTCHVVVLHPPGGVAGGDQLTLNVTAGEKSRLLVTTPGANKLYGSMQKTASINQSILVRKQASVEWFPQETIVFDKASVRLHTRFDLEQGASLIAWDILCLGRKLSGETYRQGRLKQGFEIYRQGLPIFIERGFVDGGSAAMHSGWGWQGKAVSATFVASTSNGALVDELRTQIGSDSSVCVVSQLRDVLVVRYLGDSAEQAKDLFENCWNTIRKGLLNKEAIRPRIWNT